MQPYPLTRPNRLRLARAFANVPRVDISIDCILEDQMGKAYVDSVDEPALFMVEQDGFFCYFAGDLTTAAGRAFLRTLPGGRMLMAGLPSWTDAMQDMFGERALTLTRTTFSSDSLKVDHLQRLLSESPQREHIQHVDLALASSKSSYLEMSAFDSPEDFVERGIGYCMVQDDAIIGGASSSLVCSDAIEVSIVVDEEHRRQGIATALSASLALWCLERRIAPHWDAANEHSCKLAEKLGYTRVGTYTAFYLKPAAS
jgi:GNAT superfamily N-acetyltransferase